MNNDCFEIEVIDYCFCFSVIGHSNGYRRSFGTFLHFIYYFFSLYFKLNYYKSGFCHLLASTSIDRTLLNLCSFH